MRYLAEEETETALQGRARRASPDAALAPLDDLQCLCRLGRCSARLLMGVSASTSAARCQAPTYTSSAICSLQRYVHTAPANCCTSTPRRWPRRAARVSPPVMTSGQRTQAPLSWHHL
ncbi:hypothetical protein Mpe_B0600 (plasmid) [Methylibium petroleiphilum PM1]|uniref:Uncharacterized protein n=1 Tax=Methylibium petroleiphilum (strain ATCC BAA-1232 / LMG 22953 / PM1) TaxID=420662 RepID=A2SP75_METPP|nr:hypothetical protein Mpe_B0600 [Methylibium petroleiphilum PM1]